MLVTLEGHSRGVRYSEMAPEVGTGVTAQKRCTSVSHRNGMCKDRVIKQQRKLEGRQVKCGYWKSKMEQEDVSICVDTKSSAGDISFSHGGVEATGLCERGRLRMRSTFRNHLSTFWRAEARDSEGYNGYSLKGMREGCIRYFKEIRLW